MLCLGFEPGAAVMVGAEGSTELSFSRYIVHSLFNFIYLKKSFILSLYNSHHMP